MASRLVSSSFTERAPSLHGRGRDVREHRLGLEPRIGVSAVSAIVRHTTSRKPPLDTSIDGREQPVHLLVCRRRDRAKAQAPALVFDVHPIEHERMHVYATSPSSRTTDQRTRAPIPTRIHAIH